MATQPQDLRTPPLSGRSTFAVDGKDCKVNKDVERVLKEFHEAGKPIGYVPPKRAWQDVGPPLGAR